LALLFFRNFGAAFFFGFTRIRIPAKRSKFSNSVPDGFGTLISVRGRGIAPPYCYGLCLKSKPWMAHRQIILIFQ
jgi:hypothetical protein